MTDKKFTDEEIIKGLTELSRYTGLQEKYTQTLKATFDLINRQKAEIERLKECPKCVYEYDGEMTEYCVQGPCSNFKTVEQIKSEAYKEFAERLKERKTQSTMDKRICTNEMIDNLLKEMVGEEE